MKYLAAAFFLLTPLTAFAATQQIIMGNAGVANINANIGFTNVMGTGVLQNSGVRGGSVGAPGTLSNLYFHRTEPTGTGTNTFTINVSGVATTITCTIAAGSSDCNDTTHSVSVVAGDYVAASSAFTAGNGGAEGSWSLTFTPTTDNDTLILSSAQNNGSPNRGWYGPSLSVINGGETNVRGVLPDGGTLDKLYYTMTTVGSGSYDFNLWVNGATSSPALACTLTATACNDTSNVVTVAAGDNFSLGQIPNTPLNSAKGGAGYRYIPSTAGSFALFGGSGIATSDFAGNTRYMWVSGGTTGNATEASTTQHVGTPFTITKMYVLRSAAPGSAKNSVITLRKNGVSTGLTCTMTGTGSGAGITTCNISSSVSLTTGDLIDVQNTLTSAGTAATIKVGFLATTQPAAASTVHGLVTIMNSLVRIMNGTVIIY